MAHVITFYIPASYRSKPKKYVHTAERGKLLRFSPRLRAGRGGLQLSPAQSTSKAQAGILRRWVPFAGA